MYIGNFAKKLDGRYKTQKAKIKYITSDKSGIYLMLANENSKVASMFLTKEEVQRLYDKTFSTSD